MMQLSKITSMSCICKNENNVKWIPFYTKKYDICYMSFPHNLLKKNILLVDLSARRVSPLSMFSLYCNFTICNFGNFIKF